MDEIEARKRCLYANYLEVFVRARSGNEISICDYVDYDDQDSPSDGEIETLRAIAIAAADGGGQNHVLPRSAAQFRSALRETAE